MTHRNRRLKQGGQLTTSNTISAAAADSSPLLLPPETLKDSHKAVSSQPMPRARQARLVTKRTENRTVVNAAPARGDAFCELTDGCTFLVETTKAMSASVKKADVICHRGRQDFKVEMCLFFIFKNHCLQVSFRNYFRVIACASLAAQ
jgi:septin family protein